MSLEILIDSNFQIWFIGANDIKTFNSSNIEPVDKTSFPTISKKSETTIAC